MPARGPRLQTELKLKDFQELCAQQQLPERLQAVALAALQQAGLTAKDLNACEIIGGGMRVPQMKKALATVLGLDLSALNVGAVRRVTRSTSVDHVEHGRDGGSRLRAACAPVAALAA